MALDLNKIGNKALTSSNANVLDKLEKARFFVLNHIPFFGSLALSLELIEAPWCVSPGTGTPTLSTDGDKLYYHPDAINSFQDDEWRGVLIHEIAHCMLDHIFRKGDKDPVVWNWACDCVCNEMIKEMKITLPQNCWYEEKYKGLNAEEIYWKMMDDPKIQKRMQQEQKMQEQWEKDMEKAIDDWFKNMDKQTSSGGDQNGGSGKEGKQEGKGKGKSGSKAGSEPGSGSGAGGSGKPEKGEGKGGQQPGGKSFDAHLTPEMMKKLLSKLNSKIKEQMDKGKSFEEIQKAMSDKWGDKVLEAALMDDGSFVGGAGQGFLPAGIARRLKEIKSPSTGIRTLLLQYIQNAKTQTENWMNPRQNLLCRDLWLPSYRDKALRHLAFVVDTSGSTYDDLEYFIGVFNECIQGLPIEKVTYIECDASVQKKEEFDIYGNQQIDAKEVLSDYKQMIDIKGGGGTSFIPPFEELENDGTVPNIMVYVTDGYGSFPQEPNYPVIWVYNHKNESENPPFGMKIAFDKEEVEREKKWRQAQKKDESSTSPSPGN